MTAAASAVLVVPMAGSAVAAPSVALAQENPCQNTFNTAIAAVGGGALTGGIAGPAGALAGALGGLIVGGTAVASCLDDAPPA